MDKGATSFTDKESNGFPSSSTPASCSNSCNSSSRDMVMMNLRQVNKNSHQISKHIGNRTSNTKPLHLIPHPPQPAEAASGNSQIIQGEPNLPNQTQQPPVYNINKDDFRDVVQRLTGSQQRLGPTIPPPPSQSQNLAPMSQSRPPSSRLQRIRPPPLSQITNRSTMPQVPSPLPPLPSVHTAAESPISAYMRSCFQNSNPNLPITAPCLEFPVTAYMRSIIHQTTSSSTALPPPRVLSPCGMPTAGSGLSQQQQHIPLSPTAIPVPSPRRKAI